LHIPEILMQRSRLRVLVVDDNESVRRRICQLLTAQADIEVTCEAGNGHDAIEKAREHLPDLVVLDITMPSMSGLEAARILKREFPLMHILIVTQHDARGFQWAALAAGASGYIVKTNASSDLIPEVRRIQSLSFSAG
jgi:DNA-binding NarL/FixJ family response regulator